MSIIQHTIRNNRDNRTTYEMIRTAIINGIYVRLSSIADNKKLSVVQKETLCKLANKYGVLVYK